MKLASLLCLKSDVFIYKSYTETFFVMNQNTMFGGTMLFFFYQLYYYQIFCEAYVKSLYWSR